MVLRRSCCACRKVSVPPLLRFSLKSLRNTVLNMVEISVHTSALAVISSRSSPTRQFTVTSCAGGFNSVTVNTAVCPSLSRLGFGASMRSCVVSWKSLKAMAALALAALISGAGLRPLMLLTVRMMVSALSSSISSSSASTTSPLLLSAAMVRLPLTPSAATLPPLVTR